MPAPETKAMEESKTEEISRTDDGWFLPQLLSVFMMRKPLSDQVTIAADTDSLAKVFQAAGISPTDDDPMEPVLTLRMWVIGILFCIVASGLNTLYTLRTPSLTISASVVLLLAYPLGRLWEKVIPSWNVPLRSWSFNLNPGKFNKKVRCYGKKAIMSRG